MERWTAEHRAYIVEHYFKIGESVVRTQRAFRTQFQIPLYQFVWIKIKILLQNSPKTAIT